MGSLRNVRRKLTHRLRPSCLFVGVVISVLLCMVWAVHSLRAMSRVRPRRSYYAMGPGDHGVDDRNASLALKDPDPASFDAPVLQGVEPRTPLAFSVPYEDGWHVHPHLVVYGVMATDLPARRAMRNSQRQTWLRYAPVATYDTSFEGLMLVLYVVSPRITTPPYVGNAMLLEMEDYHDVLMLRLKEEVPTINRTIGGPPGMRYGDAFHVSNTRKVQAFLLYAYRSFPSTPFIGKGDDDSYVYVPEYVRMLMQLPRVSTVFGYIWNEGGTYYSRVALGYAYTLTRDIVVDVLQDPLTAHLFQRPYDEKLIPLYYYTRYHHEDNVIGAVFSRENRSGRREPSPPTPDDRLPPVEGWGKAYMAYAMEPHRVPSTGRAVGSDGRYDVTYAFPQPDKFRPHDVLWVYDICRYDRRSRPDPTSPMRSIVSHRTITREDYSAHWEYDQALGEDTRMARPSHIEVVSVGHYNDVDIVVAGRTSASCRNWDA